MSGVNKYHLRANILSDFLVYPVMHGATSTVQAYTVALAYSTSTRKLKSFL